MKILRATAYQTKSEHDFLVRNGTPKHGQPAQDESNMSDMRRDLSTCSKLL